MKQRGDGGITNLILKVCYQTLKYSLCTCSIHVCICYNFIPILLSFRQLREEEQCSGKEQDKEKLKR